MSPLSPQSPGMPCPFSNDELLERLDLEGVDAGSLLYVIYFFLRWSKGVIPDQICHLSNESLDEYARELLESTQYYCGNAKGNVGAIFWPGAPPDVKRWTYANNRERIISNVGQIMVNEREKYRQTTQINPPSNSDPVLDSEDSPHETNRENVRSGNGGTPQHGQLHLSHLQEPLTPPQSIYSSGSPNSLENNRFSSTDRGCASAKEVHYPVSPSPSITRTEGSVGANKTREEQEIIIARNEGIRLVQTVINKYKTEIRDAQNKLSGDTEEGRRKINNADQKLDALDEVLERVQQAIIELKGKRKRADSGEAGLAGRSVRVRVVPPS